MSTKLPTRPARIHDAAAPRIAIVASEYNPEYVQGLINNTCAELYHMDRGCVIELFGVPGSFEIPLVADMVASLQRHDAIVALGVILQGKTRHADFIGDSVSHALQQVALKHVLPVIHEVLLVGSEEEARQRCLDKEINRGVEAARAVFAMLRVRDQVRTAANTR
jgi:6,7-dimethyl-8-ribityllumazine synthase